MEQRFEDGPISSDGEAISLVGRETGEISLPVLEDLIVHLLDTSSNLTVFFENYPPATELFQTSDFMSK